MQLLNELLPRELITRELGPDRCGSRIAGHVDFQAHADLPYLVVTHPTYIQAPRGALVHNCGNDVNGVVSAQC